MPSAENKYLSTIIYSVIFAVVRLMSLIPFSAGQFLGRILGRSFAMVPTGRTKVSLENLRHAFGDHMGEVGIRKLNTRVVIHFGEMLFEVPHILRLNRENLERYVVFENEENLVSAMKRGKGVFILTAHFGNWELMSAAATLYFASNSGIVARPIDFSPADRLVNNLRSRYGTEIIHKQHAMRRILKALKEHKVVGILLDQNVDWYAGVFVPFLGRLACTNKGLALMARKTGAPVVPVFSVKQPDGRYRIIFEKEVELLKTGDKITDMEKNTALFTGIIERYVRQYPDHWFWFHKRWKTKNSWPLPEDFFRH